MLKASDLILVARIVAWALAAFVVFATLGPQNLRPHLPAAFGAQAERFLAYFVMSAAFTLAYPQRWRIVFGATVGAAILLELGQGLAPGRDPGVPDAMAKGLGAACGVLIVLAGGALWSRRARFFPKAP